MGHRLNGYRGDWGVEMVGIWGGEKSSTGNGNCGQADGFKTV